MAGFWVNRWEDIRGNLLWQLVVWICGGSMVTAIASAVRAAEHVPFDWKFAATLFIFSAMALAIAMLLASKRGGSSQQQASKSQFAATTALSPASPVNISGALATAYKSVLEPELEENFRIALAQYPPNEHESVMLKLIAVGAISYIHDSTWWSIYKSQILALQELNSKVSRALGFSWTPNCGENG
jgi:uncharacterized membrane protein YfcA